MIRDVTGLNEARDGSKPDKDALVGLQKLAANASNTATKHILNSSLFLTLRTCENISLRVADMLEFQLTNNALRASIGKFNTATLDEIKDLHLYDFGIYLELEPEEEDKAMLEQNIQMALQQGQIFLEDAIDIREIKNVTLANQVLKYKRTKKQEQEQQQQQAQIQSQSQANQEATEAAAMQEVEKQQALAQTQIQIEQAKSQMEIQRMQQDLQIKQQLMAKEFEYDVKLKQMDVDAMKQKEGQIEDRKDKRTQLQASQQSKMIQQRQDDLPPTDFEGEDGMMGLSQLS